MVAKNDIIAAREEIESALKQFVANGGSPRVLVGETKWGHLWALVGSDRFKDMSLGARQQVVWDYLQKHVDQSWLFHLETVTPVDGQNYDEILAEASRRATLGWDWEP